MGCTWNFTQWQFSISNKFDTPNICFVDSMYLLTIIIEQAQPIFRDPKRYADMADPHLDKNFPEKDLNQVVAIAAMCLQEEAAARPLMSDVVTALSFLNTTPPEVVPTPLQPANSASHKSAASESESENESESESESESDAGNGKDNHSSNVQNEAAPSAKCPENEVSEAEYDYYGNENHHDYSPQDAQQTKEFYSKSSRKSRTKSRTSGRRSSTSSENGSGRKKKHGLSQKSSKKSSGRDLSQKSSKKSSVKVLSHKESKESEDGSHSYHTHGNVSTSQHNSSSSSSSSEESQDEGVRYDRGDSRPSLGTPSFGLFSTDSVHYEEGSSTHSYHNFDHPSMGFEDHGSFHYFKHSSSKGSDKSSVHSR